jgi:hypothetical protein
VDGLRPGGAPGDHLGDHRVVLEIRGMFICLIFEIKKVY